MAVDLVRQNTAILRQAAEQFSIGDVAQGKSSFAMVHHDVKEGVYYTMWERNGRPPIPKYGTNRFNDTNGISSTSIEKAQTIYQYFQSKGIQTNSGFSREQVNSYVPITLPYLARSSDGGREIRYVPSFTISTAPTFNTPNYSPNFEGAQELALAMTSNCTEEEQRTCGWICLGIVGVVNCIVWTHEVYQVVTLLRR